jgi:uncharacterized membrane protein
MWIPGWDLAALVMFLIIWILYGPALKWASRSGGLINIDMIQIRIHWMRAMLSREQRMVDSQLVGHALNSASFFASSNLILIAASGGILFGGEAARRQLETAPLVAAASEALFQAKLALVGVTLARGLLAFIWAIRQLNYSAAAIGAAPKAGARPDNAPAYAEAIGELLTRALSAFNDGVRNYYFALAAAAWLLGPVPLALATLGATGLLVWRQSVSPAARAVHQLRVLLETPEPARTARPPTSGRPKRSVLGWLDRGRSASEGSEPEEL